MSGFFGNESGGETESEQLAKEWLDPKGSFAHETEYFRKRVSEISSGYYEDDDPLSEGFSDYWVYRDERYTEAKEKELMAYEKAVTAVAKFIRASQRSARIRTQIQEEVGPLLEADAALTTLSQLTTADFDLEPIEPEEK